MSGLAEIDDEGINKDKDFIDVKGESWGVTGKATVVRPKTLPEISGESPVQSLGRHLMNLWISNNMTMRMLIVIILSAVAYGLYYYFGTSFYSLFGLILISSLIAGYLIAGWHLKRYEIRVRTSKIKDDTKIISTEFNDQDVTMKVMKSQLEGRDMWEEWSIIDPTLVKDPSLKPRMIGVNKINTGFATYIFAKDFDPQNRLIIGEGEEFPGIALIPMLSSAYTTLPEIDRWVEKMWRKGKLKPEELQSYIDKLNDAITSYNDVIGELKNKGVKGIRMQDLNNQQQKLAIGLDSVGSRVFEQYKEYREHMELPEEIRHARVMNAVNTSKETTTLLAFMLENMSLLEQKAMSAAFGVIQNLQGVTSEQIQARFKDFDLELKTKLISEKEREMIEKVAGKTNVL